MMLECFKCEGYEFTISITNDSGLRLICCSCGSLSYFDEGKHQEPKTSESEQEQGTVER